MNVTEEQVRGKLRECFDPELPCNIVDLGLVHGITLHPLDAGRARVVVQMTLTSRECPLARQIAAQVQRKVQELDGVAEATVELVFDPPWDPSRMNDEARRRLRLA
jgi:metal-sulfur cluster biosynthetic enzyme